MKKTLSLLAGILCYALSVHAQLPFIQQNLTEADGLLSNYVQDLAWDNLNRLWIGTDKGLSIYNGVRYKHYTTENGIDNSYVNKLLFHQASQCMMLGTAAGSLYAVTDSKITKIGLPEPIHDFHNLEDGALLVSSTAANGMQRCYIITNALKGKPILVLELPAIAVGKAYVKNAQTVCIADNHIGSIIRIGAIIKRLETWPMPSAYPMAMVENDSVYYHEAARQILWKHEGKMVKACLSLPTFRWAMVQPCMYNGIASIAGCSYASGYFFLLLANGKLIEYKQTQTNMPAITKILSTPNNNLLLATMGEGIKILGTSQASVYLPAQKISRITASNNQVWAVNESKLFAIDKSNDAVRKFPFSFSQPTSIAYNANQLHITTLNGYYRLKVNGEQAPAIVYKYASGMGLSGYAALTGGGYLLSNYSTGLVYFSPQHKEYNHRSLRHGNLLDDIVEKTYSFGDTIVFTSYSQGLQAETKDGKNLIRLSKQNGLLNNTVYYTGLWKNTWHIGLQNAWMTFSEKGFRSYSTAEGFAGKRALYSFIDGKGRTFVVSEKHLMLVTGKMLVPLYSQPILLSGSATLNAAWFDSTTQMLWCAGSEGLLKLNIQNIQPSKQVLTPVCELVNAGGSRQLISSQSDITIVRADSCRVLELGFNHIDFTGHAQIVFMLKGLHRSWQTGTPGSQLDLTLLPAGTYELFAYTINPDGTKSVPQKLMVLKVAMPWYLRWPILLFYLMALTYGIWRVARFLATKKMKRRLQQLLLEQKIHDERNRISSDLHDNVGSQLTSIIAQLDYVEGALNRNDAGIALNKVEALQYKARNTMTQLRESIWALREEEISLQEFMLKIQQYASLIFDEDSGTEVNVAQLENCHEKLSPWQAVNLLRIVQEALQNIQKHAKATQVNILAEKKEAMFFLLINDNGIGMLGRQTAIAETGHGLGNMRRRAAEMNAALQVVNTSPGTSVQLLFQLKP